MAEQDVHQALTTQEKLFTQIEHRFLKVTADGKAHRPEELMACVMDKAIDRHQLRHLLNVFRAKLEPFGQDVVAQSFGRRIGYRRVRLLNHVPYGT